MDILKTLVKSLYAIVCQYSAIFLFNYFNLKCPVYLLKNWTLSTPIYEHHQMKTSVNVGGRKK